jgi:hypothetical protein
MSSQRRTIAIAVTIALATSLLLAGCSNPVESFVKGATKGQVDLSGATVPADFPKSVPLYKGAVTSGVAMGQDDSKIWNVIMTAPGPSIMPTIAAQLKAAGFTTDLTPGGNSLIYDNADYDVAVVLKKTSTGYTVDYAVSTQPKDN